MDDNLATTSLFIGKVRLEAKIVILCLSIVNVHNSRFSYPWKQDEIGGTAEHTGFDSEWNQTFCPLWMMFSTFFNYILWLHIFQEPCCARSCNLLCSLAAWLGIQIRLTPLPFQPSMRPLVGLFGLRAALLKRKREQRHSLPSISIAFIIQVCYLPWWSWCVLELDEDPLNMWTQKLFAMTAVGQYE